MVGSQSKKNRTQVLTKKKLPGKWTKDLNTLAGYVVEEWEERREEKIVKTDWNMNKKSAINQSIWSTESK